MSAEEALKYGLIDEIVQPNDAKLKSLSQPPPNVAPQLFGLKKDGSEEYQFGKLVSLHSSYSIMEIYFLYFIFISPLYVFRKLNNVKDRHRAAAIAHD
jgi:enoyl-CoA hydratase/carnithine racemase